MNTVGKYELIEPLGSGGMAEVWRAWVRGAAGFRKEVALKMIRREWAQDTHLVTMFVDEARLSARLGHPNIVATLDFGHAGGRFYIALEMVEGATLWACLQHLAQRGQRLDHALGLYVAAEVAAGLEYAHSVHDSDGHPLHLIHRDVNPANVLISRHGEVKLSDFGIAKARGRGTQTEAGSLKGKIPYMSPEQAWGHELDARSDIYALGLLLYELLLGERPIDGPNEIAMLEQARAGVSLVAARARLPEELVAILHRALAHDPSHRYASAAMMREELLAALLELWPTSDPTSRRAAVAQLDFAAALSMLVREVERERAAARKDDVVAPVEWAHVATDKLAQGDAPRSLTEPMTAVSAATPEPAERGPTEPMTAVSVASAERGPTEPMTAVSVASAERGPTEPMTAVSVAPRLAASDATTALRSAPAFWIRPLRQLALGFSIAGGIGLGLWLWRGRPQPGDALARSSGNLVAPTRAAPRSLTSPAMPAPPPTLAPAQSASSVTTDARVPAGEGMGHAGARAWPTQSRSNRGHAAARLPLAPRAGNDAPATTASPTRNATGEQATLRIHVEPWAKVWLDGHELGLTPLRPISVTPGSHTVVVRNPELGTRTRNLVLEPGEGRLIRIDLSDDHE